MGKHWGAHTSTHNKTAIFYCDCYDPAAGYWMTNIHDPSDKHCISERAPYRTWWPAEDKGDHFYITQWAVRISKTPS